jgi:predicted nuclease of predicted toxin-antitoxin system
MLARVARDLGHDGQHVTTVGLDGKPDKIIAEYAVACGDVVVTNNARDFRRLYAKFVSHPGLVIMLPSVGMARQVELFTAVVAFIEGEASLVDQLVEINEAGEISPRPWPQPRRP